jgi:hypothetical protein
MLHHFVVVTLAWLAIAAAPALAQQGQYSAMQGRVVDESGAPVPGVVVLVTHGDMNEPVLIDHRWLFLVPSNELAFTRGRS